MEDDVSQRDRIAALREENEFLRQAARTFGELAERLARELDEVRRDRNLRRPAGTARRPRHSLPTA